MVKTRYDAPMQTEPVALIAGAGRGIGRATAIELGKCGYRLALLSRTQSELDETAAMAGASKCMVLPTDVTQSSAVASSVDRTAERFGRIDAVVHCAGHAPMLSIEETTDRDLQEVLAMNLSSAFFLCRAVWPTFRKQQSGAVVLVSSEAARDPFAGFAAYGAAKAGIHSLGLSLSREGAGIGVGVHVVAPGAVETAMLRKLFSTEQFSTEKTLAPEDVARVIVSCIAGDLVYSSGEVIYVHREAR